MADALSTNAMHSIKEITRIYGRCYSRTRTRVACRIVLFITCQGVTSIVQLVVGGNILLTPSVLLPCIRVYVTLHDMVLSTVPLARTC